MSLPKEVYSMVSMEELDQWWADKALSIQQSLSHRHRCPKCKRTWTHHAICSSYENNHGLTCKQCSSSRSLFGRGVLD